MENHLSGVRPRRHDPPITAVFVNIHDARGAIADLQDAGFAPDEIRVAFSTYSSFGPGSASGEASLPWRLKHLFTQDMHLRGEQQMHGINARDVAPKIPYREVGLVETLREIGLNPDRVELLNREVGDHGALVLVDAGFVERKAEAILQKNCGRIRTDTANEVHKSMA